MVSTISETEARAITNKLNRMDLAHANYAEIKELIDKLTVNIPIPALILKPETQLYRGVAHKDKPTKTAELGHPPKEKVTNFQRCNPPATSMFYCSVDLCAVLYELNAKPNDIIYLSKWSISKEFFVCQIAPPEIDNDQNYKRDIIFTFFESFFLRPVHETYSSQYKITSAIVESLTSSDVVKDNKKIRMGGVVYPSVAHPKRSENLAIQSTIANEYLQLDYVDEVLITDVSENSFTMKYTDFSSNFLNDGSIMWSGRKKQWNVPPNSFVQIIREPNGWIVKDLTGKIINPQ